MKTTKSESQSIDVIKIQLGVIDFCLLGTTPVLHNRLHGGTGLDLLIPPRKKTKNEREVTLKHDPLAEYQRSAWTLDNDDAPTALAAPSIWFKRAMASVALDLGGASKAEIGRLVWTDDNLVPMWGIPQMLLANVRSADMARTPDVRSRALVAQWAVKIRVRHMLPKVPKDTVVNLLAAAGVINGVGDWRNQKGGGTYGQFEIVEPTDKRFLDVVKTGGRKAQQVALQNPTFADDYTADLYSGFVAECKRRQMDTAADRVAKSNGNGKSNGAQHHAEARV